MFRMAFIGLLAVVCAPVALPANCNNAPIQWTIVNNDPFGAPYGFQNDSKGAYVNGQSGVTAELLNCPNASGDAKLGLGSKTTRSITASFAKMLRINSYTPSFATSGTKTTGVTSMSVRNLYYLPAGKLRSDEFTFTTRFGSANSAGNAVLLAPTVDAPRTTTDNLTLANQNYANSPIIVIHCPANSNTPTCPNIVKETWFVYPDPAVTEPGVSQTGLPKTEVGALLVSGGSGKQAQTVNGGEFSMPFYIKISLLN